MKGLGIRCYMCECVSEREVGGEREREHTWPLDNIKLAKNFILVCP